MKKLLLVVSLLTATALASCSNSSSPSSPDTTPTQTNNTQTADTYFPLTEGSTWTYVGIKNYTQTASGDSTIGGKSWKKITNTAGGIAYARWVGNKLMGINIAPIVATDEICGLDITLGAQWTFDINASGATNHYIFVDSLQGQSVTVLGKTYSNVIVLHLSDYVNYAGNNFLATEGLYYYAKGIGLVKADFGVNGAVELQSYSIK